MRIKSVELLNARLADAIDLQTQTKQAHWNLKGPHFIALHELFDKINEDVEDYVDEIAERAVQLGGVAEGTARVAAKRSSLSEYPATAAPVIDCWRNALLQHLKNGRPITPMPPTCAQAKFSRERYQRSIRMRLVAT